MGEVPEDLREANITPIIMKSKRMIQETKSLSSITLVRGGGGNNSRNHFQTQEGQSDLE